jgi:hypothetical protein
MPRPFGVVTMKSCCSRGLEQNGSAPAGRLFPGLVHGFLQHLADGAGQARIPAGGMLAV